MGHLDNVCRNKPVTKIDGTEMENVEDIPKKYTDFDSSVYPTTIYHVMGKQTHNNFDVEVIVNNNLGKVLADTGAKVSVCSESQ